MNKDSALYFPTGLPCQAVGKEFPKKKAFISSITAIDENDDLDIETTTREFTVTEINWLKRIEAILRNGMPTSDKGAAETIGHAYSEVELLLESIDDDRCMK